MSYLKPNFSNHPAHWILCSLVFSLSFYSMHSSAANGDYDPGYFWMAMGVGSTKAWEPSGSCALLFGTNYGVEQWSASSGSCINSSGNPAHELLRIACGADSFCANTPPPSPPGCDFEQPPQELYVKVPESTDPSTLYASNIVAGDCVWAPQNTALDFTVYTDPTTNDLWIKEIYIPYTDIDPDDTSVAPGLLVDDPALVDAEELQDDNREDSSSLQVNDPIVTQVGDATQTIENTIEITTVDEGITVDNDAPVTTVTTYGGVRKTVTTTTTTLDNADGSQDIVEVVETSYDQIPGEQVTYNTDTSSVNWLDIPGTGQTSTTTTTTTKDGTGSITFQGKTTTFSDQGISETGTVSDKDQQSVDCKENPEAAECLAGELTEEVTDGYLTNLQAKADQAVVGMLDKVEADLIAAIDSDQSDGFSVSQTLTDTWTGLIPNSSSCQPLSESFGGHQVTISCKFSDKFKLLFGWVIYVLTVLSLVHILFNGNSRSAS